MTSITKWLGVLLVGGVMWTAGGCVDVDEYTSDPEVGACLDLSDQKFGDDIEKFKVTDCDTIGVYRVIAKPHMSNGTFPNDVVLDAFVQERCVPLASSFDVVSLAPTSGSWQQGDREVICLERA